MKLDEYQRKAKKYDLAYSQANLIGVGFIEKVLGLVGESGEAADKFKKILRDKGGQISLEDRKEIAKELGDVLWYVSSLAMYLDLPLSEVAKINLDKLEGRYRRKKLGGEGDNR